MIGNDIVDLHYFDSPFYQHIRYLERICAPDEAEALRNAKNASLALAAVWAAKEATYKLISRSSGLRHFVPRNFVTDIAQRSSSNELDELLVWSNGTQASVTIFGTKQWLHAIAASSRSCALRWRVQEIHKPPFGLITPSDESDIARQLARELLYECGLRNVSLDFVGRIPTLRQGELSSGKRAISLSHHGRFVAIALARASGEAQKQAESLRRLPVGSSSRAA